MTSDLPGEPGALDPGLDQLFRTLTAAATPAELAGEHDALAMFRANVGLPAGPALAPGRTDAEPAGSRKSARLLRFPVRWSVRLAAAATLALCGGAAAAYAAVLPAPVQHLAHTVLGFAGVPDTHQKPPPGPGNSGHYAGSAAGPHVTSPGQLTPTPGTSSGSAPTATSAASAPPTASAPGPLLLSATAASAQITAGSEVVIGGRLTRSGTGVQGVTVMLVERLAGQVSWHVAGSGQTTTDGNVAVTVPALTANAVFRLTVPGAAPSPAVVVTVSPPIAAVLDVGAAGLPDSLVVSTQYARRGDVTVLEVLAPDGSWVFLRSRRLDASGQTAFSLSGKRLTNREVRVVLLGTVRHAAAVSSPVTVPPPG
jgi:hypothetical protein